jgi:hypothetical protein
MRGSRPGERRGGRKKGTPNKTTRALKDMILQALEDAGGVKYLKRQARENPAAFLTLIGKIVPNEIRAQHSGDNQMPPVQFLMINRPPRNERAPSD